MKKSISILIFLFSGISILWSAEVTVKSKISNVTVFPGSAQVTRTASFNCAAGTTEIIFENVSPYLNTSSIQAKGKGSFTILDVKFRYKQPEVSLPATNELPPKIVRDIALLEDSLVYLNFDMSDIATQIESYNFEKSILLNNQLVKGNGGDTITELKATMEYFRLRINDINTQVQKLRKQEFQLKKQQNRMNARLNDLRAYNQQQNPVEPPKSPIPQIIVLITCDVAVAGNMEISYMVNNAGWTPSYDLKTSGIEQPIQLVYKADVWQNTGEDWENVKLKLSTIMPTANNVKPVLPVLYLSYYNYNTYSLSSTGDKKESSRARNDAVAGAPVAYSEDEILDAGYAYNYTSMVQTMTNVEFDIKLNYSVPTDGQVHIIPIQNESIPTAYVYHIVPKLESQAFLIAKLTDWQKLDLLPGKANIYFDGTFVGETQINPNTVNDTLELALGRDRSLQIQRKQIKNETTNKLVGSITTKTITYEITVKNTKMVKTDVVIMDHIPLSTNEEIKIELTEKGKAKYFETTGILQWNEKFAAGETKKLVYSFTVEYDGAKTLNTAF
jgi:uncharacterized protein (TIGR02231 family)